MAFMNIYRRACLILVAVTLTACASSTQVEVANTQNFPSPLVVKTDVHMGIYIPDEFETYVYEDFEKVVKKKKKSKKKSSKQKSTAKDNSSKAGNSKKEVSDAGTEDGSVEVSGADDKDDAQAQADAVATATSAAETASKKSKAADAKKEPDEMRLKFRISLGEAQTNMVRSVFPGVFAQATMLESTELDAMPADIDLFMVPSITKVQYTTPKKTRQNVYEVWLQYVFTIYDRNGDVVTRWRVPSYGKTPTAMMKSKESALQTATQMALRDCGAAFSTGFRQQPAVARWLQGREQRAPQQPAQTSVGSEQVENDLVKVLRVNEEQTQ